MRFQKHRRALAAAIGTVALSVFVSSGAVTAQAQEKVDFAKQIKPILEQTCLKCHAGDEPKGNLSLTTRALTLKGGDSGPSVVPKKPEESPLYERITMAEDDLLRMPAEGEMLKKEQTDLIGRWIAEGAVWPEGIALKPAGAGEGETLPEIATKPLTDEERQTMAEIRSMGGHVLEIAQNDNRLEVAYHLADGKVTGEHLLPVKKLKGRVMQLNLRGTDITDDDLKHLSELTGLRRLHLEKTGVTDAGLEHLKPLVNLEYLNLYATKVTDEGLKHLSGLKNLKKLYIWQSGVTADGVVSVKAELADVAVIPDLAAEKQKAETARAEARKKVEEARKRAEELKTLAAREQKQAEQAQKSAEEARKQADDAAKQSTEAQKKAEQAVKAAEEAKKKAEEAKKRAEAEKKKADEARKKAEQAASKAEEAAKQAAELQKELTADAAEAAEKQDDGD